MKLESLDYWIMQRIVKHQQTVKCFSFDIYSLKNEIKLTV